MLIKRIGRILLIVLDAFLAVTSVAGGIGLLTGAISPPPELLHGSIFGSYTIPGLALLFLVGGSALAAMVLVLRRHAWGALASGLAALMIMGFEIVEVLVIGSEPGLARNLQAFYFTLGLVIAILAAALWAIEHGVGLRNVTHSRVH
jgi:peptidoglycan/LPS O-acetylase OafA/YrhL